MMKNAIIYYYNLNPINIHQSNKQFRFSIDNDEYILMPYNRHVDEINYLNDLCSQLHQKQIYCHQFVPNNNHTFITYINNVPYVLLKIYVNSKDKIILNDIMDFTNIVISNNYKVLRRDNWFELWTNKIDYFEYQVSQFGKKFPLIRESFSYFVGLAENAIMLYKNIYNSNNNTLCIAHKRIKKDHTITDFLNPLNFIIDIKVRDSSEFFKERFFDDHHYDIYEEIMYYLTYGNINTYDCMLFFTRLLFPTFYFDIYEDIINNGEDEKELLRIINRVNDYEEFLRKIYTYLKTITTIPDIEWLKKT